MENNFLLKGQALLWKVMAGLFAWQGLLKVLV